MSRLEFMAVRSPAVPVRLMSTEEADLDDQMDTVSYCKHTPL